AERMGKGRGNIGEEFGTTPIRTCPVQSSLDMTMTILELADQMWAGEADLVQKHHPVQYRHPQAEEIAEGLQVYIGIASANTVDTGDGLVMLDTGHQLDIGPLFDGVRAWRDAPLRGAVYSHHHVDHVFGTKRFEEEADANG